MEFASPAIHTSEGRRNCVRRRPAGRNANVAADPPHPRESAIGFVLGRLPVGRSNDPVDEPVDQTIHRPDTPRGGRVRIAIPMERTVPGRDPCSTRQSIA